MDPLCIRYDAGYDPTLYMRGIQNLFEKENFAFGPMRSLTESLQEVTQELSDASQLTSQGKVKEEIAKLSGSTQGMLGFYLLGNANSINYLTRANLRLLKIFKKNSAAVRPRIVTGQCRRSRIPLALPLPNTIS